MRKGTPQERASAVPILLDIEAALRNRMRQLKCFISLPVLSLDPFQVRRDGSPPL
jgi:hypothetical protein